MSADLGEVGYETEPATANYDSFGNEIDMDHTDPLAFFPRYASNL